MTLSPDQVADRELAITATDVPAIAGVDPYNSALDVWMRKTGRAAPERYDPERARRRRLGQLIEPALRSDFAERHGVEVAYSGTVIIDRAGIRLAATPDGIIREWSCGWEAKVHSVHLRHLYGRPGTDEVPTREVLQCQTGMLVTGLRTWRLTALLDGDSSDYAIDADDELQGRIVELAARWWRDHVVADRQPPADGSEAATQALRALYPHVTAPIRVATEDDRRLVSRLYSAMAIVRAAAADADRAANEMRAAIGSAEGIRWGSSLAERITHRLANDSHRTDWHRLATDLMAAIELLGSDATLQHGLRVLRGLLVAGIDTLEGGGDEVSTADLATLLDALHSVCTTDWWSQHTKMVPGSRRLVVPRSWHAGGVR
jgi:predicted phage-related endonuclease